MTLFHNFFGRILGATAAILIGGTALLGVASPALAHDELVGTDLLANESDGTVQALELSFSNSIITVGTEIIVTGPADASASDGKPSVAGPVVTQRLLPDLAEGTYTVAWRVVSSDGHPIEGGFVFFVESDGSADPDQIASIEDDPRSGDDEGSSASEATSDEAGSSGMPPGLIVAVSIGGALVAVGAVATILIGLRRRAQAFGASDAATDSNEHNARNTDSENER